MDLDNKILAKSKSLCYIYIATSNYGAVAQLARASGSYPAGREFESPRRYHLKRTRFGPSFFVL